MVTDRQVKKLREAMKKGTTLSLAAAKAGMDEQTARKYLREGKLPSECPPARDWRTRADPFDEVWDWGESFLKEAPGLEAKSLFEALQREHPGRFPEGQLRTFQRRVKNWRALEGPPREVFFAQRHHPGDLSESDFTSMNTLGVTIGGQPFDHLVYHFVLTYSNWETGTICFSESFESLSAGWQNALVELGGVPRRHRTDQLSAAVHQMPHRDQFTQRYRALLAHYGVEAERIGVACPNENGDVEQSHHRFKRAVEQALLLRGSCDFVDRGGYERFLREIFVQRNAGRRARFEEERAMLQPLTGHRLETRRRLEVHVGQGSTIRVLDAEEGMELLRAAIGNCKPEVVVLDSCSQIFRVNNENDNAEVSRRFAFLFELRDRFGVTFILLHHKAKEVSGVQRAGIDKARGASAFTTQASTVWTADRVVIGALDLVQVKRRGGDRLQQLRVVYTAETEDGPICLSGEAVTREDGELEKSSTAILQYLAGRSRATTKELTGAAVRAGAKQRTIGRTLQHLVSVGALRKLQRGWYALPERKLDDGPES